MNLYVNIFPVMIILFYLPLIVHKIAIMRLRVFEIAKVGNDDGILK